MPVVEKTSGGAVDVRGIGDFAAGDRAEVSAEDAAYLVDERGDFERIDAAFDAAAVGFDGTHRGFGIGAFEWIADGCALGVAGCQDRTVRVTLRRRSLDLARNGRRGDVNVHVKVVVRGRYEDTGVIVTVCSRELSVGCECHTFISP